MNTDSKINQVLIVSEQDLQTGESIISLRLAAPLPIGRADYFARYKVEVGIINGDASGVSKKRCFVVNVSSNTGEAKIDPSISCPSIKDIS